MVRFKVLGGACADTIAKIVKRDGNLVYKLAYSITGSHADAEDVLQSAMVRVSLHPQALAQAKFPWAYFLRIVRNEALTVARRRKPMQVLSSLTEPQTLPESDLDAGELRQQVRLAIRRLPPSQAEVVVLRIWEEMTFLEIAEVLNQSPNTVASRYRYALEKLTRSLRRYHLDVPDVAEKQPLIFEDR